jgi:tRNA(fMet)-specific endonuclease VapC
MTTSLDASVVIALVNGRSPHLRARYLNARAAGEALVVSSLVHHEVVFGAAVSGRYEQQMQALSAVIEGLPIEPFRREDAIEAAQLRAELRRAGNAVGGLDTLIAGQARFRGWSIATSTLKDFKRMPGLDIQAWSP